MLIVLAKQMLIEEHLIGLLAINDAKQSLMMLPYVMVQNCMM